MLHRLGQPLLQGSVVLTGQCLTRRKGQHGVIGAGVAIHGDRIEGALHRPSNHRLPKLGLQPGITTEECEHRRHVGMDHPRTLGHPADANAAPAQLGLQRHLLIDKIGGEDRRCRRFTAGGRQRGDKGIQPCQQRRHGDRNADHTGGADQHGLRFQPQLIGQGLGGALAIDQAAVAGAGIGLPGIDQHRSGPATRRFQPLVAEVHAGRPHHRGGESPGADRSIRRQQQGQIWLAGWLQAGRDPACGKPVGGRDTTGHQLPRGLHGTAKGDWNHPPSAACSAASA